MTDHPYPAFRARFPWVGADLQTLRNTLRGPAVQTTEPPASVRLTLPLTDGSGDQLAARLFAPPSDPARGDKALVVLVHGLGGSEDSDYIHVSTRHLLAQGHAVVQLNLRGAGMSRPLCRGQYHAGRTTDFRDALDGLRASDSPAAAYARNGIVAVGYSLGGNMVLKYAAEFGDLLAVASVSAPIDLGAASQRFLDRRNRLYHRYLLGRMKEEALASRDGLSREERELIPTLRTILEFDDRFVAPRNGFADASDYYAQNSAIRFLDQIDVPALVLHARDDPWIPVASYEGVTWERLPPVQMLLSPSGGHVGFHDRASRVPWHDRCIEVFLDGPPVP